MSLAKTPENYRRIGLMGVAVVAIIAALIMASTIFPFGQDTYTAELEHTAGLRVGEEVQVAGVGVGKIRKIDLEGEHVRVEFTLDKDIDLGKDTTAEVKVATLLGTHFLLISPAGGGELSGQNIPMSRTRVPFNLQDVLNETGDLSEKLDVGTIRKALNTVAETMDASREEFLPALRGISDLSEMFAKRSDDLGALLESTGKFSKQLAGNSDDITVLMRQANVLMTELLSRRTALHNLLVDLRAIGTQLTSLMKENRDEIGPMLDNLNSTIELLTRNHEKLGEVAELLGPTARYFANATGAGSWLDQFMPGGTPDTLRCSLPAQGGCQ